MVERIEEAYGSYKVVWHPEKLNSFLKEVITTPVYVRVKPTNRCNHKCFYCAYDPQVGYILSERFNRHDEIPKDKMMEILSDFRNMGVKAVTYSGGGEPLIYSHIISTLEKTIDYGIDLSAITNGQKLEGRIANLLSNSRWVRVSLDSSDKQTFEQIRRINGKSFDKLINNMYSFSKIKNNNCEFGVNFVVSKENAKTVYDSAKFFRDLGVNHIKITPVWIHKGFVDYHSSIKEDVLEQIKKAKEELNTNEFKVYDTYENDFERTGVPQRTYSKCLVMQINPIIGADSCVYFCHDKAYSSDGILGSIKNKSFNELWFSKESAEIFKRFDPRDGCRHHCTADLRNKVIHAALNSHGPHVNFI